MSLRSSSAGLNALSTNGPMLRHLPSADKEALRRALARFKDSTVRALHDRSRAQPAPSRTRPVRLVSMLARRPEAPSAQVLLLFGLASPHPDSPRACFLVYHPERRSLVPRAHPLRWRRLEGLTRFGVIRVRDDLLILGGYDTRRRKYKRQVLRYDLRRGRTYVCDKMNTPRADFTPFLLDGRVYCVGGRSRDGQLTRAAEYFEPMMGRWYPDSSLPASCADYGVVATDKEVLLIGGCVPGERASQQASSHVWKMTKEWRKNEDNLDALVSVWTPIPEASYPSSNGIYKHRCTYVAETRRLYVVGGVRDGGGGCDRTPTIPETASPADCGLYYLNLEELEQQRDRRHIFWQRRHIPGCRRMAPAVCTIGRRIFVVGGSHTDPFRAEGGAGCFDWRTKRWLSLFSLGGDGVDLSEAACVQLEPNIPMKEFGFDRMDWLLQWALW